MTSPAAPVRAVMEARLRDVLSPVLLEIIDDSAQHAGHGGARPGGETHFTVRVVAAAFAGKRAVERHRLVTMALEELLRGPVHALSISARTPEEAGLPTRGKA